MKKVYFQENARPEIERVNLTSREDLFKKSGKIVDEPVTLGLNFHLELNCVHEIMRKAHRYVLKCNRLSKVLTSLSRVLFYNAKNRSFS